MVMFNSYIKLPEGRPASSARDAVSREKPAGFHRLPKALAMEGPSEMGQQQQKLEIRTIKLQVLHYLDQNLDTKSNGNWKLGP